MTVSRSLVLRLGASFPGSAPSWRLKTATVLATQRHPRTPPGSHNPKLSQNPGKSAFCMTQLPASISNCMLVRTRPKLHSCVNYDALNASMSGGRRQGWVWNVFWEAEVTWSERAQSSATHLHMQYTCTNSPRLKAEGISRPTRSVRHRRLGQNRFRQMCDRISCCSRTPTATVPQ